ARAGGLGLDGHLRRQAVESVEESEAHGACDVVPPARPAGLLRVSVTAAENLREEGRERMSASAQIADFESEVLRGAGGPGTRPHATRSGPLPVLLLPVVLPAPVGVRQDVVGFGDLLEAFFRTPVTGIEVGVKLARELPVGLLDLA